MMVIVSTNNKYNNSSNITTTNYDGIRFSQGSTGGTTLGLIKVLYHNTGKTDMSLSLRHESDLLYLDDPTLGAGDGRVGIGTTTPSERLEVNGNVLANNVVVPSDRRLKRDIQPLVDEELAIAAADLGCRGELDRIRGELEPDDLLRMAVAVSNDALSEAAARFHGTLID